jgi:hypothetical protein
MSLCLCTCVFVLMFLVILYEFVWYGYFSLLLCCVMSTSSTCSLCWVFVIVLEMCVSLWLADSLTVCWFSVVLCCFYSCLIWVSDSVFGVRCALPCVSLCLSLYVSCLLFEFLLVLWLLLTDFAFAVHSQPHNWRDLHQATCVFGVLCLGVFSLSVSSQWLC